MSDSSLYAASLLFKTNFGHLEFGWIHSWNSNSSHLQTLQVVIKWLNYKKATLMSI